MLYVLFILATLALFVFLSRANAMSDAEAGGGAAVTLVENGKPAATIVVPVQHDHLDLAVAELNDHLEKVTGARLPVATEGDAVEGAAVYVGQSAATRAMGIDEASLPAEGFAIRTVPGALAIVGSHEKTLDGGHRQRTVGTLWGVYRFLEDALGIRWFFPGPLGTVIPKADTVMVRGYTVDDAPVFPIRQFSVVGPTWDDVAAETLELPRTGDLYGRDIPLPNWGAERGQRDGLRQRAFNAWGGAFANHSTEYWGERYHETHPEYFALRSDGTPHLLPPGVITARADRWSGYLDYSQPETLQQMIDDHVAWYNRSDPGLIEQWQRCNSPQRCPNDFYMPNTPADGMTISKRPAAQKLVEAGYPDDPWGQGSEYLGHFRAKFSEAMYEKFPDKKILALAYSCYTLPPKTVERFAPNMHIMLAVMPGMGLLKEEHFFKEWSGHARRWFELTGGSRLHYWQYTCWPDVKCPTAWPYAWQRWYRELRNESLGAFINGPTRYRGVIGIEHLNHYMAWRLLWNPDIDLDALTRDYAETMYGPAAPSIVELLTLVRQRWVGVQWNLPPRQRVPNAGMLYGPEGTYPPEVVQRMKALLAQAAATEGLTDAQRRRAEWLASEYDTWFERIARICTGAGDYHYAIKLDADPPVDADPAKAVWAHVPPVRLERHMDDGSPSSVETRLKVGWTDKHVYFLAEHDEPRMNELTTRFTDGQGVWRDDAVDFFLDPGCTRADNYHFMLNAECQKDMLRYITGLKDESWLPPEFALATRRFDTMWTMEVRIPLDAMDVRPATAHRWVWNFFRNRVPGGPRFMAVNPTHSGQTGKMELFPELMLVPKPAACFDFEEPTAQQASGAMTARQRGGRLAFALSGEAAPFERALDTPLTITERTAIDARLRVTAGKARWVEIGGQATTAGGQRIAFAERLKGLDASPEWTHRATRLCGCKEAAPQGGGAPYALRPGDVIESLWIRFAAEGGGEMTGEIDQVLVGGTTALDLRD